MLTKDDIKAIYKSNKKLFTLICHFNANPADYIHSSHLDESLTENILEKIKQSPRGSNKLSALILDRFQLREAPFTDFTEPRRRLALLDRKHMEKLATYAGAAYYAESITQVIQKNVVLELKSKIGEAAYLFAVKRAPFILRTKPHLPNLTANPANLSESIPEAGHKLLEICFNREPEPLLKRIKLHFPKSTHWDFEQEVTHGQQEQIWNFLHKILVNEISPSWKPCFT